MTSCLALYSLSHFLDSLLSLVPHLVTSTSSSASAEVQQRSGSQQWKLQQLLKTPGLANPSSSAQEALDVEVAYIAICLPTSAKDCFASINAEEVHTSRTEASRQYRIHYIVTWSCKVLMADCQMGNKASTKQRQYRSAVLLHLVRSRPISRRDRLCFSNIQGGNSCTCFVLHDPATLQTASGTLKQ